MVRFTHVNSYDPTVVSVYSVQYALYGNCQLCLYVSSACDSGNPLEQVDICMDYKSKNLYNSSHYKRFEAQLKPEFYEQLSNFCRKHNLSYSKFLQKSFQLMQALYADCSAFSDKDFHF